MLVTIVTETFPPDINGVAMTLGNLLRGLANAGHKIQLVCPEAINRDITTLPKNVSYHPVRGISIPGYNEAKFGLPSKALLKKIWNAQRPDVIYVATEGPLGWRAIKIANSFGIPVVSGFHTNFHSYSSHYGVGLLEKVVARYLVSLHNKTDLTLTPTIEQKNMLESMDIKNVSVLSRGVDTELFSPAKRNVWLRKKWGVTCSNEPVLLYVGRIAAEKNLTLAIETYYALKKKNKLIKFVLVGDGPLLNKLKKENPEFIFSGMLSGEDLAKHYASSDIFVFPSMTETFGNVILEAMASGLGVIAYDYAAAKMHIRHNKNGRLADFGDSVEFISNAGHYLEDYDFLEKIKTKASQYARGQSWDDIVPQFENHLFEQAFKNFNNHVLYG